MREKKGVLTSTISRYGDQIDRLTGEVAAIRGREEAVRTRLAAKQAELDQAVAELDVAKDRLEELRARLKRALVALRDRLVAMYETGSPDVLSVIVGSSGVDDLAARAEYLDRLHGMDEAVVGRVRDLRDQVQGLVDRLRDAKDRIEAARDAIASEEEALASARASLQSHQQELVSARAKRVAALAQISAHEEELHGSVAAIQGKIAAQLSATGSAPLPAGPIQGGSGGLIWPVSGAVVSGFGAALGLDARGDRHRRAGNDADPRRRLGHRRAPAVGGEQRRLRQLHLPRPRRRALHLLRPPDLLRGLRGQSVSQGDIIGYTGCTGHCLGPHLHFEVRINGSPTDPMGYL